MVRRFFRSKANFWRVYRDLADRWYLFQNSGESFQEVAAGQRDDFVVSDEMLFRQFLQDVPEAMKQRRCLDSEFYERSADLRRIGNRAVREAQAESRRLGFANVFSRGGRIYFELPSGEITTRNPFEAPDDDSAAGPRRV